MGYHTDFEGSVSIVPPLNGAERGYLTTFNSSRRWNRLQGPYSTDWNGDYRSQGAERYNSPSTGQPGLWCPWTPSEDSDALVWDRVEKPYEGEEWMRYLIDVFLRPGAALEREFLDGLPATTDRYYPAGFVKFAFNHTLNGLVEAEGEEPGDLWTLLVVDNEVTRLEGHGHTHPHDVTTYTVERVTAVHDALPAGAKNIILLEIEK